MYKINLLYQPWIKVVLNKEEKNEFTLVNKVNAWNLILFLKWEKSVPILFSIFFKIDQKLYEIAINTDNTYFLFELISNTDFMKDEEDRQLLYKIDIETFVNRFKNLYEKYNKPKVNFFIWPSNLRSTPYENSLVFEKELDKVFGIFWNKENSLYNYYDNLYIDHFLHEICPYFWKDNKVKEIAMNHIYYNKKKDLEKNMFFTVYADLAFDADAITNFWHRIDNINAMNHSFVANNPILNNDNVNSLSYQEFDLTTPIYDESNFKFEEDFLEKYGEKYNQMSFDKKQIIFFRYKTHMWLYRYLMNYLDNQMSEEQKKYFYDLLLENVFNNSYENILPLITEELKGDTDKLEEVIISKNKEFNSFVHLISDFDFNFEIYWKILQLKDYILLYEIEFFVLFLQGYVGYLLITADFCKWSENHWIIVWPGRWSAGWSLLVFLVWITTIDPLPFELLFYRFLNPSRVSPPDIDLDFEDVKRDFPILYCQNKYGFENTCKIGTYMAYQFKNTFKSLCKFLGVPFSISNLMAWKLDEFKDQLKEIFAIDIASENNSEDSEDDFVEDENIEEILSETTKIQYDEELLWPVEELTLALIDASEINFLNTEITPEELKEKVMKVFLAEPYLYKQIFNSGIHACGTVISPKTVLPFYRKKFQDIWKEPLTYKNFKEVYPWKNTEDLEIAVSYLSWPELEDQWYLKFDFLWLKNLSIIGDVAKELGIKDVRWWVNDIIFHKMADPIIYEKIFSKALTTGVFQFESLWMKKYLKELQPTWIEDLIAMVSLFRPWPMAFIPSYIARKRGEEEINPLTPEITETLINKYGEEKFKDYQKRLHDIFVKNSQWTFFICVYQEQLMKLSQYYAGFSMAQADNLRRIIGKKKLDKIPALLEEFKEGARKQDFPDELTEYIFKWIIEPAASYSFNKSHAACYAIISYINGYLKYYYPLEFYKALINFNIKKEDKIFLTLQDLYLNDNVDIKIELPNFDNLEEYCKMDKENNTIILWGLALKGLSKNFLQEHVDKKNNNVNYTFEGVFEKYETVSKKDIESILKGLFIFKKGFLKNKDVENKFYNFVEEKVFGNLKVDRKYFNFIINLFLNKIVLEHSKEIVDELKKQKKWLDKFLNTSQEIWLFWNTMDLINEQVDFQSKILYQEITNFMNRYENINYKDLKSMIKESIHSTIKSSWYDVTLLDKVKLLISFDGKNIKDLNIMSLSEIEAENKILQAEYKENLKKYEAEMNKLLELNSEVKSELNNPNLIVRNKESLNKEAPQKPKMKKAIYSTIVFIKDVTTIEKWADIAKIITDIFLSKNVKTIDKGYKSKIENFMELKKNINNVYYAKVDEFNKIIFLEEI